MSVEKTIEEIAERNGGRITPDMVIEHARNPKSPLHHRFNWDVEQAAYQHWRATARQLINSVMVKIQTSTTEVRCVAYVRDPEAEHGEQGYVPVANLVSEQDRKRGAFLYELARLSADLDRVQRLAEAFGLEKDVVKVQRSVATLHKRASRGSAQAAI